MLKKIFEFTKLCFKHTNNPITVFLFRLNLKKNAVIKTKHLGEFKLSNNPKKVQYVSFILNTHDMLDMINEQKKDNLINLMKQVISDEKYIEFEGIKFLNNWDVRNALIENYLEEGNSPFSTRLNGKIVIDIGGNVGDTALKFAKEGAIVYAFEPVPPIYEIALENIKLNPNLKENIHFFNNAVSSKKGNIEIRYLGEGFGLASSAYLKGGEIFNVESVSMNEILQIVDNPDLLQMDCEGSEYDIIPNADLSSFEEVVIEYHSQGNRQDIIDKLNYFNFEVNIFAAPMKGAKLERMGIIHGIKKCND